MFTSTLLLHLLTLYVRVRMILPYHRLPSVLELVKLVSM